MLGVSQDVSNCVPDQEKFLDKSIKGVPWKTSMRARHGPLERGEEAINRWRELGTEDHSHGEGGSTGLFKVYLVNN